MTLADAQLKLFMARALVDLLTQLDAGTELPFEWLEAGKTAVIVATNEVREIDTDDVGHVVICVAVSASRESQEALAARLRHLS